LLLGDNTQSVCFDSEGYFMSEGQRPTVNSLPVQKFQKDQVLTVLLNLDASSPNANTVSLYRDGVRITVPRKLPESMIGKALHPHVNFKNSTVQVNFGQQRLSEALPFSHRLLQAAAAQDVTITAKQAVTKDGKFDVVFPVCLPGEGAFDWLDGFLENNPGYTELSDRKLVEWAVKSDLWQNTSNRGYIKESSHDKPDLTFGPPRDGVNLDDPASTVKRLIEAVTPIVPRSYIVMELKSNLVPAERKAALKRFNLPCYKRSARVIMGEPTKDYKKLVHNRILKDKQERHEAEYKAKIALFEQKKRMVEAKKKMDEQVRKNMEEAQKLLEGAKKAAEALAAQVNGDKKEEGAEKKDGVVPPEAEKEEEEEKKEEEKKEEEEEQEPLLEQAVLTEDEEKSWYRKSTTIDIVPAVLNSSFASFALPERDEGFDDVSYDWLEEQKCKEHMKQWMLKSKISTRIEDLRPSDWFQEQWAAWKKTLEEWHTKQNSFNGAAASKAEAGKEGGEEASPASEVDIFGVQNVGDIGSGEPLFAKFEFEDWALLSLRAELDLLMQAFEKDVNDPERPGMHESHLTFYYSKYFQKAITPKLYGVDSNIELSEFVKDVVIVSKETGILEPVLKADQRGSHDIFVKLTEESRRQRQRRMDAGDDTAKVNFLRPTVLAQAQGVLQLLPQAVNWGGQQRWGHQQHYGQKGKGKW